LKEKEVLNIIILAVRIIRTHL